MVGAAEGSVDPPLIARLMAFSRAQEPAVTPAEQPWGGISVTLYPVTVGAEQA